MRQSLYLFILKLRNLLAQKFKQYDAKLPYLITVFIALIIVVFGVNVFIELTDTLESDMLNEWDSKITTYVISHRNPDHASSGRTTTFMVQGDALDGTAALCFRRFSDVF